MFVKEMPAILNLELVQGAAELDALDCSVGLPVELLLPPWLVAVHYLVELLENNEVCKVETLFINSRDRRSYVSSSLRHVQLSGVGSDKSQ